MDDRLLQAMSEEQDALAAALEEIYHHIYDGGEEGKYSPETMEDSMKRLRATVIKKAQIIARKSER